MERQPQTSCEGLQNLLNTSQSDDIDCMIVTNLEMDCEKLECSSSTASVILIPAPCDKAIRVIVTDVNGTTRINSSLTQPQSFNYREQEDIQYLNVSVQVVTSDNIEYYLVMSESSFGVDFSSTAIPVCPQLSGNQNIHIS